MGYTQSAKLQANVSKYYPKYAERASKGKRMPLFFRLLHPKIDAACETRHEFEKNETGTNLIGKIVMENAEDLICFVNLKGTTLNLSESYVKQLGYAKHELIGKSAFDIIHPEDQALVMDVFQEGLAQGTGKITSRLMKKDGTTVSVESIGKLVNEKGQPVGAVIVNRDMTEINRLMAELKEADVQNKKLFHLIGHDLRSPFNTILGFLDMLEERIPELSQKEITEYVGFAHKSALRAFEYLNMMFQWARLNNGSEKAVIGLVDAFKIAKERKEANYPTAFLKGIRLVVEGDEGAIAMADAGMLEIVLQNLIMNSIKFTDSNGKIKVLVGQKGGSVTIAVSDNGVGISPERLQMVFSTGIESTTGTNNEKGTGFGLATCNEMVKLMGGKISVQSELGRGTTFTVTLPAAQD